MGAAAVGEEIRLGADWEELAARASGRAVLVVGPPDSGKSTLIGFLARALIERGERVARITGDPGQPSFGVPTCAALAFDRAERAEAMWFVGSTTPVGHLLPITLGIARLADRARAGGAETIFVDASGFVSGPTARVLAAHTLLAARADLAIAIGAHDELPVLAGLLERCGAGVARTGSPGARDRTPAERRAFRDAMFARHFARSARREIDPARIVGADWTPLSESARPFVVSGSLAGLIDAAGFCLGLGVVLEVSPGRAVLDTPIHGAAARIQIGRHRLNRDAPVRYR